MTGTTVECNTSFFGRTIMPPPPSRAGAGALSGSKISEVLQSVAKACHPDLTRDEIICFSSHSGRVWAIVILGKAGMLPDFIKSRLRWMGDSYRLYLRDTSILQQKHLKALERASTKFTALFGENRMTLPDVVPVDNTMDSY